MNLTTTCIKVQPEIWEALSAVASAQGLSRGALVRQLMARAVRGSAGSPLETKTKKVAG
jgi:hypothetical protein